ncbi:MAG: cytochrome c [Deltaproteobacteria bacterium]|nr:cytochrome c [Deltaproteobacteria bacterium]
MRKNLSLVILISAAVLFILNPPGESQKTPPQILQTQGEKPKFLLPPKKSQLTFTEKKGQALYDYYCVLCHGAGGNGDGFNSYTLTTPPAKLADPNLMTKLPDAQIVAIIKGGGRAFGLSPQMPSWGGLFKDKDLNALVAYVRTLSRRTATGG